MPFMQQDPRRLVWQQNDRYLWIEPWGENSLRVRSGRHLPVMRNEDWALTEPVAESQCHIDYEHHQATLTNGKLSLSSIKRTSYLLPPSTQTPVAGVLAPAGRNWRG